MGSEMCIRDRVPSKFLYFPDENHWVLKPANSILWHHTVNDWLRQYIGSGSENAGTAK